MPTLPGTVPPVGFPNTRLVSPAAGAQVGVPPQVVLAAGIAATSTPLGRASVNVRPDKDTLFSLVRVKVNVDVPLTAIGSGEKAFASVGGYGTPQPVKMILSMRSVALGFPLLRPLAFTRNRVVLDPGVIVPANVVQVLRGVGFALMKVEKGPPSALACTLTVILFGFAQFPVGVGLTSKEIPTGSPEKLLVSNSNSKYEVVLGPGPSVTGLVANIQPVPDQEFTGFPAVVLIICTPGSADPTNRAVVGGSDTLLEINEYTGGTPVP